MDGHSDSMRIICHNPKAKIVGSAGAVSFTQAVSLPRFKTRAEQLVDVFHKLWAEIHSWEKPTPEQFQDWCNRVPCTGKCGCKKWLAGYVKDNPIDYENFPEWACELHRAVSRKLGKPEWIRPVSNV